MDSRIHSSQLGLDLGSLQAILLKLSHSVPRLGEYPSLYFIKEKPPAPKIRFYAPYSMLRVSDQKDDTICEYLENLCLTHNYPLVLALGILLVEICRIGSKRQPDVDSKSLIRRTNDEHTQYYHIVNEDPFWPDLGLNTDAKTIYKKVASRCLDNDIFCLAPSVGERRDVIFKEIVSPLQKLLTDMKWLDESGKITHFRSGDASAEGLDIKSSQPLITTSDDIWSV
jgi:hypothetical protein